MSKIFIQPYRPEELEPFLEYARTEGFNLEIATFASSGYLDVGLDETLAEYRRRLRDFGGEISIHGAFMDLHIFSRDSKIAKASRERIEQCLNAARVLNAKYAVFHSGFNPLIKHESYRRNWVEKTAQFWKGVLDRLPITILIENIWEPSPEFLRRLIDEADCPGLKICLDTGHINVHSEISPEVWFEILGSDIRYIHVNDNYGDTDSESVPGQGNIDWPAFSMLIRKYGLEPNIIFEVGDMNRTKQAVAYFKEKRIYPFDRD